ncbi:MAG: hypothetical protein OXD40_03595 [bacterium]|nr:hypothetical protein [bacterium]
MKRLAILAVSVAFNGAALADDGPGFTRFTLDVAHHDTPVEGAVWYPADAGGERLEVGENAVFVGVPARKDAVLSEGRYPVVLLSHGLGGRVRTLAWLAAGLAERGAIVIGVNHPNSTTLDLDLRQAVDHWTRARDLQAALDYLLEEPRWLESVDQSRIMAAGFSFGGWTALSMGGVTGHQAGFAAYCEEFVHQDSVCRDLARADVDLRVLDVDRWNASYRDGRVAAVAAIDPWLHPGLQASNVTDLVDNILLIGLGSASERNLTRVFGVPDSNPSILMSGVSKEIIVPARHFTALLTCKPSGAAILKEEGDDPVCDDPQGTDRGAVHRRIVSLIAGQLGLDD